jgi:MFS transporter, DHA2 family, methylenomycin A resistance protein
MTVRRCGHRTVPVDWVGQVTAVLAMGGLTFGAIEVGVDGFTAPEVMGALAVAVVAVVALAAFLAAEARVVHPMVPLDLFRSRTVSIANAVGFAFIVGYYGLPFLMSLYLQQLRGVSSLGTGLAFLPMMLVGAVLTPFSARIAERLGARVLITGGLVLTTAGLVVLAVLSASTPVWVLAVVMALVGLAGPLVMPPVTAVLLNSVPGPRAGTRAASRHIAPARPPDRRPHRPPRRPRSGHGCPGSSRQYPQIPRVLAGRRRCTQVARCICSIPSDRRTAALRDH